jgi:methionyl-tRNA formyltransferase
VTQPDKPAGRDQRLTPPAIKAALAETSIPIFQPLRIKSEEALDRLRKLDPEVIVVMAYGQILPKRVLEIPTVACLNLHASLLPRWRGAAPIQAAISNGDEQTGITVVYMDEGLDTGDILLKRELKIAPGETGGSLHDRLAGIAPEALSAALQLLQSGNAPRIPQESIRATYAPKLEREHGRIDWNDPAEVVERKMRAFDPWPGAFTMLYDEAGVPRKLKVFGGKLLDGEGRPGGIVRVDDEIVVGTSRGALSLGEVQLEGKRRMSAGEFAAGWRAPLRVMQ